MYPYKPKKKTDDIVFGFRPVIEAIESGKEIDRVLIKTGLQGELYREVFEKINSNKIPFQFVPIEKLNNITQKNHQGIIAFISPVEYVNIEQILPTLFEQGVVPLVLVLDGITDVRNFGAIVRTAECAGVNAVLIPIKNAARINADAIKTSAGAIFNINICRAASLKKSVEFLKNSGLQIIAASEKAAGLYYKADYSTPTALILGSEDTGISDDLIKLADALVKIPILGKTGSLNVSNAASVILYEMLKQRGL